MKQDFLLIRMTKWKLKKLCKNCQKKQALHGSKFCSSICKDQYADKQNQLQGMVRECGYYNIYESTFLPGRATQ